MAIHIETHTCKSKDENKKTTVHHVPCTIKCDDEANVSTFFEPNIIKQDFGLLSSFRGYPLMGKELIVPNGFNGYVLFEANEKLSNDVDRTIYVSETFKTLQYWNYDKQPSVNDSIHNVFNWISLSTAIHSPVDDLDIS